jgi:hypothetical protein
VEGRFEYSEAYPKAGRALALTIFFAVASLAAAPDTAYAQRGGPGTGPGSDHSHAGGAPGSGHGHAGGWHRGTPGGWHRAGPRRHGGWYGSFGWYGPGWNWGSLGGGLAGAATAPSPNSYRFLYDSPYYYPDYDSYHGFPYPYY